MEPIRGATKIGGIYGDVRRAQSLEVAPVVDDGGVELVACSAAAWGERGLKTIKESGPTLEESGPHIECQSIGAIIFGPYICDTVD